MLDHQDDATIIEMATPDLRKAGVSLYSPESRTSFLAQYKKAKLDLIAKNPLFRAYELVNEDQRPTTDTTLASWLIRNQAKALASEKMVFIDFRAPIEWEALLVSDDVM